MKLENKTAQFLDEINSSNSTPIYQLSPEQAREVLEKAQSGFNQTINVRVKELQIPSKNGKISLRIVYPEQEKEKYPVILMFHGGGWILGSFNTHERLARQLVAGTNAAVIFVEYTRSPESVYPGALEECYAALEYIAKEGNDHHLDASELAVVGDSAGGNIAIAVTMLAKKRNGPKINFQVLFYPVTDASLNTQSYNDFKEGFWLSKPAMEWFWNAYCPDANERKSSLLSPVNASRDELVNLPPALIITAENDVLRDEGEAYARILSEACVNVTSVRFIGTIHDFVMLNALKDTPANIGAVAIANTYLRKYLGVKTYIDI